MASVIQPDGTTLTREVTASSESGYSFGPFTETQTGKFSEVDTDVQSGGQSKKLNWSVSPTRPLKFALSPATITTNTAPYTATLTGTGSNFTNLTKIAFTWAGATSATWLKGDANWPSELLISCDSSVTMTPTVVAAGDPSGTTSWTVTLTDSSGASLSQFFSVTFK